MNKYVTLIIMYLDEINLVKFVSIYRASIELRNCVPSTHADHFELCVPHKVRRMIFSYARSLFSSRFIGTFLLSNFWTTPHPPNPTHPPIPPSKLCKNQIHRENFENVRKMTEHLSFALGVCGWGGVQKVAK